MFKYVYISRKAFIVIKNDTTTLHCGLMRVPNPQCIPDPSLHCERRQKPELNSLFTTRDWAGRDLDFPFNINSEIPSQSGSAAHKSDACPVISQNDRDPPALMTFTKDCADTHAH